MITARFFIDNGLLVGFSINGHAESAPKGSDIICASVSSAAYMTVNTITEIIKADGKPEVGAGYIKLVLSEDEAMRSQWLLKGFELHMRELSKQYPQRIRIIYGGYKNA